jgi:hypothetical protein
MNKRHLVMLLILTIAALVGVFLAVLAYWYFGDAFLR